MTRSTLAKGAVYAALFLLVLTGCVNGDPVQPELPACVQAIALRGTIVGDTILFKADTTFFRGPCQ